jgi:periplasmic protein TonB
MAIARAAHKEATMFEDATFHSGNTLLSQTPRWLPAALGVNLCLLAAMVTIPLLFPEAISTRLLSMPLIAPAIPAVLHADRADPAQRSNHAMTIPTRVPTTAPDAKSVISRPWSGSAPNEPIGAGASEGVPDGVAGPETSVFQRATLPTVKPLPQKPVSLSEGVTTGLLLSKTVPAYPAIAKMAGVSGTVLLDATISTTGTIENLRVIGGPPMLRQAAIDAVKTWRYRPYLLNRQPVEVETTVQIVFTLGNH